MQFESLQFLTFLLAVLTVYWALARWRVAQKWLLLLVSIAFYATYSWKFVAVLAGSAVVNFYLGRYLSAAAKPRRKRLLAGAIVANVLYLGVFKYLRFFMESLEDLAFALGIEAHMPILKILLPIGVSFYTFQSLAYLIDVYRGTAKEAKNLLDFSLFLAFFPQLLIGPICRRDELIPQIEATAPPRLEEVSRALSLIASGLFKRMVLGSLLFTYGVSDAFFSPDNYSSVALWVTMFAYSVQIYCDFGGYTDLMRGIGMLFGFRLPDNFNGPYAANHIGEFWRRWHMTFSHWLREFIYFPLGGSKCSPLRSYFNLFVTMFVCGIWHGASWGFVIWGTLHGLALIQYKFTVDRRRARGIDTKSYTPPWYRWLVGWAWTFFFVSFVRIFFYSPDLTSAGVYIQRMVSVTVTGDGFNIILLPIIVIGLVMNFVGRPIRERCISVSDRLPLVGRLLFWVAIFMFVFILRPSGVLPNAYFRF